MQLHFKYKNMKKKKEVNSAEKGILLKKLTSEKVKLCYIICLSY